MATLHPLALSILPASWVKGPFLETLVTTRRRQRHRYLAYVDAGLIYSVDKHEDSSTGGRRPRHHDTNDLAAPPLNEVHTRIPDGLIRGSAGSSLIQAELSSQILQPDPLILYMPENARARACTRACIRAH